MIFKALLVTIAALTLSSLSVAADAAEAIGSVQCASVGRGSDGYKSDRPLYFAALEATDSGYDLLLVEERGKHLLSLNGKRVIIAAGTLNGQTIVPWNLVAYNKQPVQIEANGKFLLEMMVSTRSYCRFTGVVQVLNRAEPKP